MIACCRQLASVPVKSAHSTAGSNSGGDSGRTVSAYAFEYDPLQYFRRSAQTAFEVPWPTNPIAPETAAMRTPCARSARPRHFHAYGMTLCPAFAKMDAGIFPGGCAMNTSRMKWFNRPPMRDFTINAFLPPGVFPSVTAGESIVSTAPFKNTDDTTSDKKNFGSFNR